MSKRTKGTTDPGRALELDSQYMKSFLVRRGEKTNVWLITNKKSADTLGHVKWFGAWRQYCFDPYPRTTFNRDCLRSLASFLESVNAEHRGRTKS